MLHDAQKVRYRFRVEAEGVDRNGLRPFTFRFAAHSEGSGITPELTWGETSHTQAEMKEELLKQSRCFALTSK